MLLGKFIVMPAKPKSVSSVAKMSEYRARLRAQGLRPGQIWVPDPRSRGFARELRRQVARLKDKDETEALNFIEAVAEEPLR